MKRNVGTFTCPPSYSGILDSDSCQNAASKLGLNWQREDSWSTAPYGCYYETSGKMTYFNTNTARKGATDSNSAYGAICGKTQACAWKVSKNMFSAGLAGGVSTIFATPLQAQDKCVELGKSKCRHVTCGSEGAQRNDAAQTRPLVAPLQGRRPKNPNPPTNGSVVVRRFFCRVQRTVHRSEPRRSECRRCRKCRRCRRCRLPR